MPIKHLIQDILSQMYANKAADIYYLSYKKLNIASIHQNLPARSCGWV